MAPKPSSTTRTTTKNPSTGSKHGKSLKKATPKASLSTSERQRRLFTSLCAQIDGGHFTNAIKTCDKLLLLEPTDADALQTKLFLLLQTEQYEAALDLIITHNKTAQYAFERAYSLYRLHREVEVVDQLEALNDGGHRGVVHLEAQLKYRQGSYQQAYDLYGQLLDTSDPSSEEHSDVLTNLQASQKHLDFINTKYLQVLDTLPSSLANSLESSPPPAQATSALKVTVAAASVPSKEQSKDAPKKPRKSRIPAGVVPGVTPPPDPERWLKKSERSTFSQGKRRKAGGGGATQGANVDIAIGSGPAKGHSGQKGKKKK
ncbi:hypothetical protein ONZ45_g6810 [Pleurotus djamor]|nr:hypothetical protein ONZ45_g6810 [Pleurotus djamor]